MNIHKISSKTLNALFSAARENNHIARLNDPWQQGVMNAVRKQGLHQGPIPLFPFDHRIVWRFATVTVAIALVFSVYVLRMSPDPKLEIAALLADTTIEYSMTQYVSLK